ncbi:MAG TPA: hypothetical protein VFU26_08370 [Gaiellaceae bacterium]|jgi:hypothetical protein|nr:hypothetical protein [Gaiellaceae bacterium]
MRAAVAAALAAGLLLVASGCGSSSASTHAVETDAAALVPASALAFVSADADLDSEGWRAIKRVSGPLKFDTADFRAAIGGQLSLAVLAKHETVAIVKPKDEAKLRSLAAAYKCTVQRVGEWSVVARSPESFQAVRDANSGTSLADTERFKDAVSELDGSSFAFAYANGSLVAQLPASVRPLLGSPRWLAAQVQATKDDVSVHVRSAGWSPVPYEPTLLRDVPSGAILAVSFKDASELPFLQVQLRGVDGEGVLYVVPGAILPVITLEVQPRDPAAAEQSLRAIGTRIGKDLPLSVERRGGKVFLTTAEPGLTGGGRSLVDDQPFKDALAAADVPKEVTWLAYADIQRLAPLVQAFGPLLAPNAQFTVQIPKDLDTLVAFGTSGRLDARVSLR